MGLKVKTSDNSSSMIPHENNDNYIKGHADPVPGELLSHRLFYFAFVFCISTFFLHEKNHKWAPGKANQKGSFIFSSMCGKFHHLKTDSRGCITGSWYVDELGVYFYPDQRYVLVLDNCLFST